MSQSNTPSGSSTPKRIARAHRHRPDKSGDDNDGGPQPACPSRSVGHSIEEREWIEKSYTECFIEFYEPCKWCFPDGPPDVDAFKTVIRSTHQPTTYHRPRTDSCESLEHAQDCDGAARVSTVAQNAVREVITTIAELREGDMVVWEEQTTPMRVVENADKTGEISLVGPNGGEYLLEERHDVAQSYYIDPSFGYCGEIVRLVPNDRPQPEVV